MDSDVPQPLTSPLNRLSARGLLPGTHSLKKRLRPNALTGPSNDNATLATACSLIEPAWTGTRVSRCQGIATAARKASPIEQRAGAPQANREHAGHLQHFASARRGRVRISSRTDRHTSHPGCRTAPRPLAAAPAWRCLRALACRRETPCRGPVNGPNYQTHLADIIVGLPVVNALGNLRLDITYLRFHHGSCPQQR